MIRHLRSMFATAAEVAELRDGAVADARTIATLRAENAHLFDLIRETNAPKDTTQ